MKNLLTIIFISLCLFVSHGQIIDSFDDGDFTNNPTWVGNTADFIVNNNKELQLNSEVAGESYLSTLHNLTQLDDRQWKFKIKYEFSPSNNNYSLTYLTSTDNDLSTNPDGIFFRIGENGSNDPIQLIERSGGVETTILQSTPGIVASNFDIHVKIIYRSNGDWELYTDLSGEDAFQLDNTANYQTAIIGDYIGIWLKYTVTNGKRFYYDDFYAGAIEIDNTPPSLDTVYTTSGTELNVKFSEGIDKTSGETINNYSVNKGIGTPLSVQQSLTDGSLFTLTFSNTFDVNEEYTLTAQNISDYVGNTMGQESKTFKHIEAQTPDFGDIIINEFIPRVSPSVGLPEVQFVELYNRSNKYFNLKNWKLSDNNSSGTISEAWLAPGEYLILTPSSGLDSFPNATTVTSWATLNQTGDDIKLSTDDGTIIDRLTYTNDWYQDDNKKAGGWSIERINPFLPCSSASNWRASIDPSGGTPGYENSVLDSAPDTEVPLIIDINAVAPNLLTLTFSKEMDADGVLNALFTSEDNLTISSRAINGNFPTTITLEFAETLIAGKVYYFTFENFYDCSGNSNNYSGFFVIPQAPEKGDLIINEILFNPLTGGSDFVEIYNNSDKFIDLKDWQLANIKDDEIANHKAVEINYVLNPNDYVVLTRDSSFQLVNYPFAIPGKFIQLSTLPAYNNDSSTVILLYQDSLMDKVAYHENWHFSLLTSKKGVSLERISANESSNSSNNWHSAGETMGFATPGRVNSQNMSYNKEGGSLSLSSNTFSPDADGFEDVLLIDYEVSSPDLLGNITIYDDKGRKIKTLLSNHLLGGSGTLKWEGTKDDGTKANIGPYIIIFEIFDVNSSKLDAVRKVVTLAGKL